MSGQQRGSHPNSPQSPPWPLGLIPRDVANLLTTHLRDAGNRRLHVGLLANRFLPTLPSSADRESGERSWRPLHEWIVKRGELLVALQRLEQRQRRLCESLTKQNYKIGRAVVRAHSRITTGLGREHPTEIGFTFHRWGAPYLPASGLKGVARRAAPDPESADQLFGNQDKKGSIVVLDGVIVTAGRGSASRFLELDVMNPHYPGYYRGQGLPSESDDPIPLTFLTIPKGASLSVVCAGRAEDHARDALEALIRGLSTFGFGAKTSSGYGWLETEEITYE